MVDIKKRRLTTAQMICFGVVCAAFPVLQVIHGESIQKTLVKAFAGFIIGFLFLFISAMIKTGLYGGADIWITAGLGLVFGIHIAVIIAVANLALFVFGICTKKYKKEHKISLPLLPFLLLGSIAAIFI